MRWYINDLSLQGQFESGAAFVEELKSLLSLRRSKFVRENLYCSRDKLRDRPVSHNHTVVSALWSTPDRDFRNLVFQWLDRFGPFWEEDRQEEKDDYFQYESHDVTDQGLGEAARRMRSGNNAGAFSFIDGEIDFRINPLRVQHGLSEGPIGFIDVPNAWEKLKFKALVLQFIPASKSWSELLAECAARFDFLLLGVDLENFLSREAFSESLGKSILDLLAVLDALMSNRAPDGALNEEGRSILQKYFVGTSAWFSNESDQNKVDFEEAMTFADPENPRQKIICFWHGKINTPPFRIHFEWPVPKGKVQMKVPYIGPKISKR